MIEREQTRSTAVAGPLEPAAARALDVAHILHPVTAPAEHARTGPLLFRRAEGVWLEDVDGKRYLDGSSGLWCVNIGHGRRELAEAAARQMSTLDYVPSFGGFSNEPAVRLAAWLAERSPGDLRAAHFTSGGSESNESAFKIARAYWALSGRARKTKIISRLRGYHGVTLGAMSATGMAAYWGVLGEPVPGFLHINPPYRYRCPHCASAEACTLACADELEQAILREGADTVAAFIAEPVAGSGGVIPPTPGYFQRIREICDRHQVLFIADEVITGFGRTGRLFAMEHWGVVPDLMSLAKGITSGYFPLGAVLVREHIYRRFLEQPESFVFMHGFTYSGHPVGCAVALANLAVIEGEGLVENAARMGERLQAGFAGLARLPMVGDVRGFGMMASVELVADKAARAPFGPEQPVGKQVALAARERGLLTRPLSNNVVAVAPPLISDAATIDRVVSTLAESIEAVARRVGAAG